MFTTVLVIDNVVKVSPGGDLHLCTENSTIIGGELSLHIGITEGQFTDFFFRTPPLKSQKNHMQNHKITKKIKYGKHRKSQITEKLLKNHTNESLEITKITKNQRKKIM